MTEITSIDEMNVNKIIIRSNEKSVTKVLCKANFCDSKTNHRDEPRIISAIFDAMDSYGIEGMDTPSFLCLVKTTIRNVQTQSYGETYIDCITMLLYMFQDIGMCRIESNILKQVSEHEQEQAAKEFKRLQMLNEELG